ncbi:hypothetical protein ACLOJK_022687, partial [Asimina triloba]
MKVDDVIGNAHDLVAKVVWKEKTWGQRWLLISKRLKPKIIIKKFLKLEAIWRKNVMDDYTVMAPKHNIDKGKAPIVEEESRGPRTRFTSSTLIIREQQERARETENRAAQMGPSSDTYEEEEDEL